MVCPAKTFSILFNVLFFLFPSGLYSTTLTITNKCTYTVWPALLSGAGSSPLPTTGFALLPGDSNTLPVPPAWSGRLWGRTLCYVDITRKFTCVTGDCGTSMVECAGASPTPPVTLVEFYFNGTLYDISLVDGFNLPVRVVVPGSGKCSAKGCFLDLNACPMDLKVIRDGEIVACKNTCQTEPCTSLLFFKTACSDAHVYTYDHDFFTCSSSHYTVTFCPTFKSLDEGRQQKRPFRQRYQLTFAVISVISVICGLIIFRIRLRLSNRDWEISLSAGTRADTTIVSNA